MRLAHFVIALLAVVAIVAPVSASTYIWTAYGDGATWADSGNWYLTSGAGNTYGYPNAPGDIASITQDSAPLSLTLGAPITIGQLITAGSSGPNSDVTIADDLNPLDVLTFNNLNNSALLSDVATGGATTFGAPMNLVSNLRVSGDYYTSITSPSITGTGGITVAVTASTYAYSGAGDGNSFIGDTGGWYRGVGTYTGDTVIEPTRVLYISGGTVGPPSTPGGQANDTNFLVAGRLGFNSNEFLEYSYGASANTYNMDRIGDSATVSMRGGVCVMWADNSDACTEKFGTLEINHGLSTFNVQTPTGGVSMAVTVDNLVRKNSGAVVLNSGDAGTNFGDTLGTTNQIIINNAPTQYLVGGNGSGEFNKPIIPWMETVVMYNGHGVDEMVTYNSTTKSLQAMNLDTDFYQVSTATGNTINDAAIQPDTNVRIIGDAGTATSTTVNNTMTVNSLVFSQQSAGGATTATLNITDGKTLTISSGRLMNGVYDTGTNGAAVVIKAVSSNSTTTLNFGTSQGILEGGCIGVGTVTNWTAGMEVDCNITGSGGLMTLGSNNRLGGVRKSYTGDTIVADGGDCVQGFMGLMASSSTSGGGVLPITTRVVVRGDSRAGRIGLNDWSWQRGELVVDTADVEQIAAATGGGTLYMSSLLGEMAIISPAGTLPTLNSGDIALSAGGTLSPGDVDLTNPRWNTKPVDLVCPMQLRGNFRHIDGTLNMYLGGPTENSQIQMVRNSGATAPGSAAVTITSATALLNVTVLPGYKPAIGDQWLIMDCTPAVNADSLGNANNAAANITGNYIAPVPAHLNGGTFVPTVNGTISSDDRYYFATTLVASNPSKPTQMTQMYLSVIGMAKEGDATKDGRIGADDLALVGLNWDPSGKTHTWVQGDFDGDGAIGPSDLADVGLNWAPAGYVTSSDSGVVQPTPEPVTMALLAIGGLGLLARRNRR